MGIVRRQAGRAAVGALTVAALLAAPAAARATLTVPPGSTLLSNELTLTRWTTPYGVATVREAPDVHARKVTRLRLWTEDGFPEVYLVLRRYRDARGRDWLLLRLPMRPNGQKGWAPAGALGPIGTVHTYLVIDRHRLVAVLYRDGRRIWSTRVGVGKASTPTPAGRFWIREKMRTGDPFGFYGPWALGTSAYSRLTDWPGGGVVGIHGTSEPWLIPGRPSHGCVRMRNGAIANLVRLVGVGTAVTIL